VAVLLVDTDVCIDHLEGARRLPRRGRLELVVDRRVALKAGELGHQGGLRLPDALVAATALVHSSPW
jgi:predicted nucleic acid-binding protein